MISCAGNKSNFEEKIKALWEERLFRYGFSQLKALEFFVFRKMIMPETGNHLLCGWCSKCL